MKCKILALAALLPALTFAQFSLSIRIGPPVLPVYTQPPCPGDGYLWTPGYWAYGEFGYYWVPGVWVLPPRPGVLWTPGYWGFAAGTYTWHAGYWGPHIGFYGGVNYGFGYGGRGFVGGAWQGNTFRYNTAVTNVNTTVVKNVYVNKTVVNNNIVNNRVSFNGPGGASDRPTASETAVAREQHFAATQNQLSHEQAALRDRNNLASVNRGAPPVAAMDSINGRRFNQQGRIADGVASGQITPREGQRLEHQQATIAREARADRVANNGHLNQQNREEIQHQQTRASENIARQKHDAQETRRPEHRDARNDREKRDERR